MPHVTSSSWHPDNTAGPLCISLIWQCAQGWLELLGLDQTTEEGGSYVLAW